MKLHITVGKYYTPSLLEVSVLATRSWLGGGHGVDVLYVCVLWWFINFWIDFDEEDDNAN